MSKIIGVFAMAFGVCICLVSLAVVWSSWWGVVGIISGCGNVAGGYWEFHQSK